MVGFQEVQFDIIITLPSYFQTLPEGLSVVLHSLDEDTDLVISRRYPRHDPWINRVQNRVYHYVIRSFAGVRFHDMSCSLRAIRRQVVREVTLYGDQHRFLPLLAHQRGFKVRERDVLQHPADCHRRGPMDQGSIFEEFLILSPSSFSLNSPKSRYDSLALLVRGYSASGVHHFWDTGSSKAPRSDRVG